MNYTDTFSQLFTPAHIKSSCLLSPGQHSFCLSTPTITDIQKAKQAAQQREFTLSHLHSSHFLPEVVSFPTLIFTKRERIRS